jgi:hypothetical protein
MPADEKGFAQDHAKSGTFAPTIPDWLPRCLEDTVSDLYAKFSNFDWSDDHHLMDRTLEALVNVVTDKRMNKVWRELSRSRRNERVSLPKASNNWSSERQRKDFEMQQFLEEIVYLTATTFENLPAIKRYSPSQSKLGEWKKTAVALRQEAAEIRTAGGNRKSFLAGQLLAAAEAYDELSGDTKPSRRGKKPDAVARDLAIEFSRITKTRFGSPLFSTLATTISVVLRRRVTARSVRDWLGETVTERPRRIFGSGGPIDV